MRRAQHGKSNSLIAAMQQYRIGRCANNYVNYKNLIDQQISKFSHNGIKDFCNKCNRIKKDIFSKDKDLMQCYDLITNKLIEDPDIKAFIDNCPEIPECYNKRLPSAVKHVQLESEKRATCVKKGNCKNEMDASGKVKSPATLAPRPPNMRSPQRQISQNPSGEHTDREMPSQQAISLQTQQGVKDPTSSTVARGDRSESVANKTPNIHAQVETSKQTISDSSHSSTSESDSNTRIPSSQGVSTQEPNSAVEVKVIDSSESSEQSDLLNGQPTHDNTQGMEATSMKICESQAHHENTSDKEPLDTLSTVQIASVNGEQTDGNSIIDTADREVAKQIDGHPVDTHVSGINSSHSVDITTSSVELSHTGSDGIISDAKNDTHTSDPRKAAVGEDASSETHCSEIADYPSRGSGSPCSKEEDSKITAHNDNDLGTLSYIYNVIINNKNNMIKTSIPMGIVLLLTLLFKYTPLCTILTKRKRNKRSHMNEKLQRVLQQPSTESEERSIPFSYSAFEYSS
ncbi:PIR protein [Plasmodium vivax]|uniref:VIR protein n=1 Tax=Plasmodium vivax TaxID=5855 RepID=A0A565A461_PLAVI|nr:PIR protein [Plasmodium vivax]